MSEKTFNQIHMQLDKDVAIAYISTAVPDAPRFYNNATHLAGLTFTRQILYGLVRRFSHVTAFSAIAIETFPRGNQVWVEPEKLVLENGTIVNTVPFLNITGLKQMIIGLCMFLHIVAWGLKNRQTKKRVVFSFNITVPPILFTALAGWLVKAKVVAHISDIVIPGQSQPNTLLFKLDYLIQPRFIRALDGLIVVSDPIAQDFGSGRPYLRMEGGVSTETIQKTGQYLAQARRDNRLFTLIASGTLLEHNGINLILQTFQLLVGAHYRLKIAGRGPLERVIREAALNDPRIVYLGYLSYDDLLRLHASADLLLNIRLVESLVTNYAFPSKTIEYLLSGVPVISTPTGHMQEEFADFCFMLHEESPVALVNMICHVERLNPEERKALGKKARDYIVRHKSWDRQCDRICDYISNYVLQL